MASFDLNENLFFQQKPVDVAGAIGRGMQLGQTQRMNDLTVQNQKLQNESLKKDQFRAQTKDFITDAVELYQYADNPQMLGDAIAQKLKQKPSQKVAQLAQVWQENPDQAIQILQGSVAMGEKIGMLQQPVRKEGIAQQLELEGFAQGTPEYQQRARQLVNAKNAGKSGSSTSKELQYEDSGKGDGLFNSFVIRNGQKVMVQWGVPHPSNVKKAEELRAVSSQKFVTEVQEIATKGAGKLADLDVVSSIISEGDLISGPFANEILTASKIANQLGIPVNKDNVAPSELFQSIVSNLAITSVPKGQGSTSDFERKLYGKIWPQLTNSIEGMQLIVDMKRALIRREQEYSRFISRKANDRPSARNIHTLGSQWLDNHPVEDYVKGLEEEAKDLIAKGTQASQAEDELRSNDFNGVSSEDLVKDLF